MLKRILQKIVDVQDRELRKTLWATAYGFSILFSYYILRAVRDEISAADRGNLQFLWTTVFLVMLVAVPMYSWIASRYRRGIFIPVTYRFFIANLSLFFIALTVLPEGARTWIDRFFYVWASVFALFVVTVFWGFMADYFRNDEAKRLFGFIAVGSSLGGVAGSALTATFASVLPPFSLLLIACIPLELASWIVWLMNRNHGTIPSAPDTTRRPLGGNALSGIKVVFRSSYLLRIAGYLLLMTFASTVLYFQQAELIGEAITERGARTSFYAKIDLAVNLLTIISQVYLTARIIKKVGIGISLALVPALVALGFFSLGMYPLLAVLVVLQVGYRAGRYGVAKPVREVLFTVVNREEKYKSKAFLDAAVYRGGDLVSGWIYAGLAALGLSVGAIALTAVPLAAIWAMLGYRLGRQQEILVGGTVDVR